MRRLPIYFVVGTGESMRGEPIESVKNGLQMLIAAIRKDPQCLETAYISIITFGDHAVQLVPLTPIDEFAMPDFTTGGGSALGEALQLLCRCREREVVNATAEQKGDWRPLAFILTDHVPTDDPRPGMEMFCSHKWGASVCCAAGPGADKNLLEKIAPECVIELASADQSTLSAFFKWVTQSARNDSARSCLCETDVSMRNWTGEYFQCRICNEVYAYTLNRCLYCGGECVKIDYQRKG